jgi:SARP family transcriptional regulator, regulator of embCAB operon
LNIGLMGPLMATEQGISIVPSASKPKQMLALLAVNAGRMVSVPALMEELWGERPPRSADTTLQTYILQLRRRIAVALPLDSHRSAKDVLATRYGGYVLDGDGVHSDVDLFNDLVGTGRRAYEGGDYAEAADQLRRGLALWRGDALADVPVGRLLELEKLGLDEARMSALQLRIDADLRMGRHSQLVGELRVLAARHPMNENLCMQLMIVQCGVGHASRALEAYQALRRTLADELGIDPCQRAQRLQRQILEGGSLPEGVLDRSENRRLV